MSKNSKLRKIPDKKLMELTQAVRFAYGDPEVDKFFSEIMAAARRHRALRIKREQKGRV